LADAGYVMATLVNMCSPGLRILATHRVLRNLPNFDTTQLLNGLAKLGALTWTSSENAKTILTSRNSDEIVVGVGLPGRSDVGLLRAARNQDLDVRFLHERILGGVLGVGEEAVREERFLVYVRGIDAALETLQQGAQAAFLLQPTGIDDVARISLSGGVMPQKSTDFYPKLLSGMTIYRLER
jgi:uncharacterized protein (DUF1015 family)